eukprot:5179-Heterococcus_DN1.PRE.2
MMSVSSVLHSSAALALPVTAQQHTHDHSSVSLLSLEYVSELYRHLKCEQVLPTITNCDIALETYCKYLQTQTVLLAVTAAATALLASVVCALAEHHCT